MGQLEQKETYQLHAKKLRRNKERTMDGNEALVGKPKTFVFFFFTFCGPLSNFGNTWQE